MSFGEGNLRTAVAELQGENDRLRGRVSDLERCVRDLWPRASFTMPTVLRAEWEGRLHDLDVEVDG